MRNLTQDNKYERRVCIIFFFFSKHNKKVYTTDDKCVGRLRNRDLSKNVIRPLSPPSLTFTVSFVQKFLSPKYVILQKIVYGEQNYIILKRFGKLDDGIRWVTGKQYSIS